MESNDEIIAELKKPSFWVGLVIVLAFVIPATWFAWHLISAWHYGRAYDRIRPGDSEQRVLALMGKPDYKAQFPNAPPTWDAEPMEDHSTDVTSSAAKVFWYAGGLAQQYAIGFNEKGRAVTKYRYTSP